MLTAVGQGRAQEAHTGHGIGWHLRETEQDLGNVGDLGDVSRTQDLSLEQKTLGHWSISKGGCP